MKRRKLINRGRELVHSLKNLRRTTNAAAWSTFILEAVFGSVLSRQNKIHKDTFWTPHAICWRNVKAPVRSLLNGRLLVKTPFKTSHPVTSSLARRDCRVRHPTLSKKNFVPATSPAPTRPNRRSATIWWSHALWPDWASLESSGWQFSYYSSPSVWWLFGLFLNATVLSKNCFGFFLGKFTRIWATLSSHIWSHLWREHTSGGQPYRLETEE